MSRAVLSVGSNLGDRLAHLRVAVDAFRRWLVTVSPVYETDPWGPVEQQDYLNAVLIVADDTARPADWLQRAWRAESRAGRVRELRWGPRTLDVDLVDVSGLIVHDAQLTLPHPRAGERGFVLVPWAAADPDAVLLDRPVRDWLADLPESERAAVRLRPDLVLA